MKVKANLVKLKHPYEEGKTYGYQLIYEFRPELYCDLWRFVSRSERTRLLKIYKQAEEQTYAGGEKLGGIEISIKEIDLLQAQIAGYDQLIEVVAASVQSAGNTLMKLSRQV